MTLDDAPPGYYWIKLYKGRQDLSSIYVLNDKWIIVRISREMSGNKILSNIYFPKEDNYGKSKCSIKYFKEKTGINHSDLIPIEEPKI
jgi:hypothetical protein